MLSASSQFRYRPLQLRKEFARMCAVHLCMMKVERKCRRGSEKPFVIFTPDQKRIVENAAIHANSTIDFSIHDGRCADDHTLHQVVILAVFCNLLR